MRVRIPATGGQSVVATQLLKNSGHSAVAPARFCFEQTKGPDACAIRAWATQRRRRLRASTSARIEHVRIWIHWLLMLERSDARFPKGKRTQARSGQWP
jgi:hypothetical protein